MPNRYRASWTCPCWGGSFCLWPEAQAQERGLYSVLDRPPSRHAAGRRLNGHFGLVSWRDGASTAILVSSCGMMASQWPFCSRPVAGWRLNGHFVLIPWRDSVSTAILVSSRGGMASQRPFWSRHAACWRLNGHFGLVMRHDGVSMAILASSCDMTASQRPFWPRHAAGRRLNGHFGPVMRHDDRDASDIFRFSFSIPRLWLASDYIKSTFARLSRGGTSPARREG